MVVIILYVIEILLTMFYFIITMFYWVHLFILNSGPDLDNDDDDNDSPRPGTSSGGAKPLTAQQQKAHALVRQIIDHVDGETYSFA